MKNNTNQSNHSSNTIIQVFKPELIIEKALQLTDKEPLNETQLAKIAGFNDNEIQMLEMFWNPVFNQSWIYLSDELILGYLTNDTKETAIANFYRRILLPTYTEGIDYQEVSNL